MNNQIAEVLGEIKELRVKLKNPPFTTVLKRLKTLKYLCKFTLLQFGISCHY